MLQGAIQEQTLFSNELEEKILEILSQQEEAPAFRVMESVLLLHRAKYDRKSIATKFSDPFCVEFSSKNPELSVFNNYGLRKMPLRAQRALVLWSQGFYPIQLLHYTPTPWQILQMQALGERCVSMDNTRGCLTRSYEGKNYFDFILHDLVHADHFFHQPKNRNGQIGFARFMLQLKEKSCLGFLEDKKFQIHFQNEFDYLISDMNSHPLHLVLTLKSLLDRYFRESAASDHWLHQAFHETPQLADALIANDRSQSVQLIEQLFVHKAAEEFRLDL